MARPTPFVHPVAIRYLEVDQQRVVFNMWYLAYLDDAMTAFLHEGGLPYQTMLEDGHDVQVVHTEVDWRGSLRWGDRAGVRVALERIGRTSFTLGFEFLAAEQVVATAATVYVVVAADGSGKCEIPPHLRLALGPVAP